MAAREEPDRIAVIDPDGREWTAGELLQGADQLVHALRARGVREHDPVATLTANRAELLQTLLAIFQAGWQYVPLNTSLTADEVGYILARLRATAPSSPTSGTARWRRPRPTRPACRRRCGSPLGAIPGFVPIDRRDRRPTGDDAARPRRRPVHAVHVGHHGSPEGGAARSHVVRPRDVGRPLQRRTSPATTSSPAAMPSTSWCRRCTTCRRSRSATSRCTSSTPSC